jgi:GNAT superfamily N-acetyltransferase
VSQDVQVTPVSNRKELTQFVEFPFRLYSNDPNWVPPLVEERLDFFDHRKNPFFEHAREQLFIARRNDEIVGVVGAVVDENHNAVHNEKMGAFGFFDCIDDQTVATALVQCAEEWVRAQGMNLMRGPLNFTTNQEAGLLVEGYGEPPMVMMTYNPKYYPALIESQGYSKAMDVFAYIADLKEVWDSAPRKVFRVADKAKERSGLRFRNIDFGQFKREVELVKQVYNAAWERNWGFVPMTDREFDHLAAGLKQIADPRLVVIAETTAGKPVGVSIALPDVHQALRRSGGGHYFPFGLVKFLWYRRKIDQCRLLIMGVIEEYRNEGIDAVFYVDTARTAIEQGYKRIESSWILENNVMMNRILERVGAKRYKTYRIYEKPLA